MRSGGHVAVRRGRRVAMAPAPIIKRGLSNYLVEMHRARRRYFVRPVPAKIIMCIMTPPAETVPIQNLPKQRAHITASSYEPAKYQEGSSGVSTVTAESGGNINIMSRIA